NRANVNCVRSSLTPPIALACARFVCPTKGPSSDGPTNGIRTLGGSTLRQDNPAAPVDVHPSIDQARSSRYPVLQTVCDSLSTETVHHRESAPTPVSTRSWLSQTTDATLRPFARGCRPSFRLHRAKARATRSCSPPKPFETAAHAATQSVPSSSCRHPDHHRGCIEQDVALPWLPRVCCDRFPVEIELKTVDLPQYSTPANPRTR